MSDRLDLRAMRAQAEAKPDAKPLAAREVRAKVRYQERETSILVAVPNGEQRTTIDRMAASLAAVSWAQLTPLAQARFYGLAVYAVCVSEAPDWMEGAVQEDDDLLFAIVGAWEAHAARYFRRNTHEGGEAAGQQRVVVAIEDA